MACVLNTEGSHLLDHTAPLASLGKMPLLVTEEENAVLAAKYYPEVELRFWPDLEFRLKDLAAEFDCLIESKYWAPHLKQLFRNCFQKEMQLIFCPHGQSDKGYGAPLLAPYQAQDGVLLYGDLLKEMLQELNIWDSIQAHATIGNYRLHYFQKHRERLLAFAQQEVFSKLNSANKTLLYAPTWRDADQSSTFFAFSKKLIQELPEEWNLILKIHPLLEKRDPALFYRLAIFEEKRKNFTFVHEFPLVYPLLEKVDAYLGDYSSIGYDFLAFQKPMFFLQTPSVLPGRLHSCGKILSPDENIFAAIEKAEDLKQVQSALYAKAFAPYDPLWQKKIIQCSWAGEHRGKRAR
ncbi:MAG TPA: CDP-glycerol glycerophosphotransferase family protein [Chlamydiales bacterium]|jgi:hypothetical protein|nr:CDP-glycerol glycerophosphotransferase family protein [Chlamydiales bacterium]